MASEEAGRLDNGCRRLRTLRGFVEELMDPDFGLLDQLLSIGALSRRELHEIRTERTFENRNARVIDCILRHENYSKLINVLKTLNQTHLVNYLNSNGEYSSEFGDVWPLSDTVVRAFNRNQFTLIDLLESNELTLELYSWGVINKRQRDAITSHGTPHEKNEALLDILLRCSRADLQKVVNCLQLTMQPAVVDTLIRGGMIVKVEVKLDDQMSVENEETVAKRMNEMLIEARHNTDVDCPVYDLQRIGLKAARARSSIALYFLRETKEELESLRKSMENGSLKKAVSTCFNRLMPAQNKYDVRLVWSEVDYAVKRSIFEEEDVKESNAKVHRRIPEAVKPRKELIAKAYIFGVTKSQDEICILTRSPNAIHTYSDQSPFKLRRKIRLNQIRFCSNDIGFCPRTSSLYVMDSSGNCVWQVSLDNPDDPEKQKIWLSNIDSSPWTLSVGRKNGYVLILRNMEDTVLELYDPNATKGKQNILEIKLSDEIINSRHAIQAYDDNFMVLHEWKKTRVWGVSKVNQCGEILERFEGSPTSQPLRNPCHLALGPEDRVIIADYLLGRILCFSKNLESYETLLTKEQHGLQQPMRLFFNEESKELLVGLEGGKVIFHSFDVC